MYIVRVLLFGLSISTGLLMHAQTTPSGGCVDINVPGEHINLGTGDFDNLSFPLNISAWVYFKNGGGNIQPIFTTHNSGSGYAGVFIMKTANYVAVHVGNNQSFSTSGRRGLRAANVIQNLTGRWIHISANVRGMNDMDLFINGVQIAGVYDGSASSMVTTSTMDARIGHQIRGPASPASFNGEVDEISIWNKSLTANDIRNIMCAKLTGNEVGLYAYYPLDGTGNAVLDHSGNNRNGNIVGSVTRIPSSAPIGNRSSYSYGPGALTLTHYGATGDTLNASVGSLSSNHGVHIYEADSIPVYSGLPSGMCDTGEVYYGTFHADVQGASFSGALSFNGTRSGGRRANPTSTPWNGFVVQTSLPVTAIQGEYILGSVETINFDIPNQKQCTFPVIISSPVTDPRYSYLWSTGAASSQVSISEHGIYTLTVSTSCATFTDTFEIQRDTIYSNILPATGVYCGGNPVTIQAYGGNPPPLDTIFWSDGTSGPVLQASSPGWYTVWAAEQGGCWHVDSVEIIEITNIPGGLLGPDTSFCLGSNVVLTIDPGWSSATWSNGMLNTGQVTVNQPGQYWVSAVYNGCEVNDTIEVDRIDHSVDLGPDHFICTGDEIVLSVPTISGEYSALWSTGSTDASITVNSDGTYWVAYYRGNCIAYDTVIVSTLDGDLHPPVQLRTLCIDSLITLTLHGLIPVEFQGNVTWNTGEAGSSITVDQAGLYTAVGESPCGPYQVAYLLEEVQCRMFFFIPLAFSPNGDRVNDVFEFSATGLETFLFEVYDRWGNLHFRCTDAETFWNGKSFNGVPSPVGVYVWKLSGKSYLGDEVVRSGKLMIIK